MQAGLEHLQTRRAHLIPVLPAAALHHLTSTSSCARLCPTSCAAVSAAFTASLELKESQNHRVARLETTCKIVRSYHPPYQYQRGPPGSFSPTALQGAGTPAAPSGAWSRIQPAFERLVSSFPSSSAPRSFWQGRPDSRGCKTSRLASLNLIKPASCETWSVGGPTFPCSKTKPSPTADGNPCCSAPSSASQNQAPAGLLRSRSISS